MSAAAESGTETGAEPVAAEPELAYTPQSPRYPEIEVQLLGRDASILSVVTRATQAMRRHGVSQKELDEFFHAVVSKPYEEVLHEVLCWVEGSSPDPNAADEYDD